MSGKRSRSSRFNYRFFLGNAERRFPSLKDEKYHDLACAIIEQAVWDWAALDYGNRGYAYARNGNTLIYRAEVEGFFKSEWFELLLSYSLPKIEPKTVRERLGIEEPNRRASCASC